MRSVFYGLPIAYRATIQKVGAEWWLRFPDWHLVLHGFATSSAAIAAADAVLDRVLRGWLEQVMDTQFIAARRGDRLALPAPASSDGLLIHAHRELAPRLYLADTAIARDFAYRDFTRGDLQWLRSRGSKGATIVRLRKYGIVVERRRIGNGRLVPIFR